MATLPLLVVALLCAAQAVVGDYPAPFTRELVLSSPPMTGSDVVILQNLLLRDPAVVPKPSTNGTFDRETSEALARFQKAHPPLRASGSLDEDSANAVLRLLSEDGYKDDGQTAASKGYLYKVYLPVHRNRSIETTATLYNATGGVLLTFVARAHGENCVCPRPWPDFNNTVDGLNEFSSNGNTPTGLMEFDLNTPEDNPQLYGPYPVNRAVQGLAGNAGFLVPSIRDGILMHTGEWPNWQPPMSMPNSEGCMHVWPENIKAIADILQSIGVVAHPNTNGKLPYPYKCQGILSVELID